MVPLCCHRRPLPRCPPRAPLSPKPKPNPELNYKLKPEPEHGHSPIPPGLPLLAYPSLPPSVGLSSAVGCRALSVDYTLAPEGPWPTARDEVSDYKTHAKQQDTNTCILDNGTSSCVDSDAF